MLRYSSPAGLSLVLAAIASAFVPACGVVDPEPDPLLCRQTYEFGNFGCGRVVAIVEAPPQPWPEYYRWDVRARPAREGTGAKATFPPDSKPGVIPLELTRVGPPVQGTGDTASIWVSARMLEDPRPVQMGVPLPVFAADSVLHLIRFAPVGSRPVVDTVRLTMKRR